MYIVIFIYLISLKSNVKRLKVRLHIMFLIYKMYIVIYIYLISLKSNVHFTLCFILQVST